MEGENKMNTNIDIAKMEQLRDINGLIKALTDENYEIQKRAAKSLAEIGDINAIEPLIKNLSGPIGNACLKALVNFGKPAVPYLIKAIDTRDLYLHVKAIQALGLIKDKRAFEPLLIGLEDKDSFVRKRTAEALGRIGDLRALPYLINLLKDDDEFVKIYAIIALGDLKDIRAIRLLEDLLLMKTSSISIKEFIKEAIDSIKTSDSYMEHIKGLQKELKTKMKMDEGKPEYKIADIKKILEIKLDKSKLEKSGRVGGVKQKKFSICPYCGHKLIFKETPKLCPFCEELLAVD